MLHVAHAYAVLGEDTRVNNAEPHQKRSVTHRVVSHTTMSGRGGRGGGRGGFRGT